VGVRALHPRTYGYGEHHSSIDALAIQEDRRGINLKIFRELLNCPVIPFVLILKDILADRYSREEKGLE
jgi:hypothetical protein